MRAIWSLVVVVLVAATGAPRVQARARDATALGVAHHDAALVPARRTASVTRHRVAPLLAIAASPSVAVVPPRSPIAVSSTVPAASPRPHDIARSARGPPHR